MIRVIDQRKTKCLIQCSFCFSQKWVAYDKIKTIDKCHFCSRSHSKETWEAYIKSIYYEEQMRNGDKNIVGYTLDAVSTDEFKKLLES